MQSIFSTKNKYIQWRKLWVALAIAEKKIGLPITDAQISSLKKHIDDIDFIAAEKYETTLQHDVMAPYPCIR